MRDYRQAGIELRQRLLLDYAVKLTREPAGCGGTDVAALRDAGYSDRAILEAVHVIGFFNHINRVADALGVTLEPGMPHHPDKP